MALYRGPDLIAPSHQCMGAYWGLQSLPTLPK